MDFSFFCKGIYDSMEGVSNQEVFVHDIFRASGSSYSFSGSSLYSNSNYGTKLFNGSKPLNNKLRDSFPNPIDKNGLMGYLQRHISESSVRTIMNYFSIPSEATINILALTRSLADQLQIIIHEPETDKDIIEAYYQQYMVEQTSETVSCQRPLYDGDKFWVGNTNNVRNHSVDFYEHFTHTWRIENQGKVSWKNRKLVCQNDSEITPCVFPQEVVIPETQPKKSVTISVEFDARGVEKEFISKWMMVNENGQDCFPGLSGALNVIIDVRNLGFRKLGGNSVE